MSQQLYAGLGVMVMVACGPTNSPQHGSRAPAANQPIVVSSAEPKDNPPQTEPPVQTARPKSHVPTGVKVRKLRREVEDSPDCVEMYSWCEKPPGTRCTSAPFTLPCGQVDRIPGTNDWVECACP